ncbi:hypothetical protein A2397_04145 [Candidatus Amesbacteria bacterium RIFOXYB1_FULL_44_23]|uniref:Glycosyltransferase RgtA/B/C/D-like domain-containing protein n=1 Tax=Candidatus Amesbacteria bacterium RIFOXYB1_FULL_44_23 TaxID=1797263 RepID=A0A1F4ZQT1_9BACT|nr:MAG: hypothetical protein A2397_04145 [Candidatus Amesbacteria bacterium RIFOXYB1_FULL_44_23]
MARANLKSLLFWELLGFFLLATLPRLWRLPADLQITYDQGLHSLDVWKIWHDGHISLLGHPTDVPGIFHGPIYYWLMLPFYVLGRGNPAVVALWQALTHSFSVILVYMLAWRLFNRQTARISAFIFAVSFGFISFARWLNNVNPVIPFSLLFFLSLEKSRKNPAFWFPFSALVCSLIIQFNGAIGVFLLPVLLLSAFIRPTPKLLSALAFFLPHLPLVVFDLRHNFLVTKSILNYSLAGSSGVGIGFSHIAYDLSVLVNQVTSVLVWPFAALSLVLILFTFLQIYRHIKKPSLRRILFWTAAPILSLFLYKRGAIGFFYWSTLPLILILISFAFSALKRPLLYLVLLIIAVVNIYQWQNFVSPNFALTPIGTRNLLTQDDRVTAIDWIYKKAAGRPIYLWTYTIPYLLDHPWRYYFIWYGKSKYGYLPESFGGASRNDLPKNAVFFALFEPNVDRPANLIDWKSRLSLEFPELISDFRSHDAIVEFRQ